jgi:hypothetical protein
MIGRVWLWRSGFWSPIVFMAVATILGFVTPGYDQMRDTISVLAIKKYGWIQEINFIQVGIGLSAASYLIWKKLTESNSVKVWRNIVLFCIIFLITEIIFPIDEMTSANIWKNTWSFAGVIHLSALAIFFLAAPYGIYKLKKILKREPKFSNIAGVTGGVGYLLSGLCYMWTYLFVSGLGEGILGIMQKIIVAGALSWFIKMMWIIKSSLPDK